MALNRSRWRRWRAAAIAMLLVLAIAPPLLASKQRAVRHVRAWAIGARLLDDQGVILQTNRANCGHACLMTALVLVGRPIPRELIDDAANARVGLTLGELVALGRRSGLPATLRHVPAHCVERALDAVPLPSIALVGTHYVLIEGRPDDGFVMLVDPSIGRMRMPLSTIQRDWRGAIVTPDTDAATGPSCGPTLDQSKEG